MFVGPCLHQPISDANVPRKPGCGSLVVAVIDTKQNMHLGVEHAEREGGKLTPAFLTVRVLQGAPSSAGGALRGRMTLRAALRVRSHFGSAAKEVKGESAGLPLPSHPQAPSPTA